MGQWFVENLTTAKVSHAMQTPHSFIALLGAASICLVPLSMGGCDSDAGSASVGSHSETGTVQAPNTRAASNDDLVPVTQSVFTIAAQPVYELSHMPYAFLDPDKDDGMETFTTEHMVNLALEADSYLYMPIQVPHAVINGCKVEVEWTDVVREDGGNNRCSPNRVFASAQTISVEGTVEGDLATVVHGTVGASVHEGCDYEGRAIALTLDVRFRELNGYRFAPAACRNPHVASDSKELLVATPVDFAEFVPGGFIVPLDSDGLDFRPSNFGANAPVDIAVTVDSSVTMDEASMGVDLQSLAATGVGMVSLADTAGNTTTIELVPVAHMDAFSATFHTVNFVNKTNRALSDAIAAGSAQPFTDSYGLAFNITNVESNGVALCTAPSIDEFVLTSLTPQTCSDDGGDAAQGDERVTMNLIADGKCQLRLSAASMANGAGASMEFWASFSDVAAMKPPGFHARQWRFGWSW